MLTLPHRRHNPLRNEWVLVSPHRANRPWQGAVEKQHLPQGSAYHEDCYLCPRNKRSTGIVNSDYSGTFVFENDFPAIFSSEPQEGGQEWQSHATPPFIQMRAERGICRVICYSPFHNLGLNRMSCEEILAIIDMWQIQYEDLSRRQEISHVMIFENKGETMGSSNPHPHGQIWATESIPCFPAAEARNQQKYFQTQKKSLLIEYADWEHAEQQRVVLQNAHWIAVVPFWAVWPYEVMLLPRQCVGTISELSAEAKQAWAEMLGSLLQKYDALFSAPFPYSMGVFQRPCDRSGWEGFCMRQHFFPPLLRSASVRKFFVGYELCAEAQRDITPESAAEILRNIVV